ncbi:MAG: Co2+/Mg2+ efflux protein ApaG [Gammaproteobacteria bacterium]|nr:MAG: Co2+/Mg2+ efflux protein ApaG [Gammaproteobacteria bacterium]
MNQVVVFVTSEYLPNQSDPAQGRYAFAYHIRLENRGDQAARLLSRHWVITDGNAKVKEVSGPGVVGETPRIEPGNHYQYSSSAVLDTEVGTMEGSYQMISDSGENFDALIPPFLLAVPGAIH